MRCLFTFFESRLFTICVCIFFYLARVVLTQMALLIHKSCSIQRYK